MDNYILCISVFIFSLAVTVIIESRLIPFLSEGGPTWHLSKSGTPTMGGIAFLVSISLSLLVSALIFILSDGKKLGGASLLIALIFSFGNALIGIFDDLMKLHRKENAGLTPMQKLGLQLLLSILFLMARRRLLGDGTIFALFNIKIELGILYYPLAIIILLGVINCANLTDGIDGLASSVAIAIGFAFLVISYGISYDAPIISSALIGGCCGFLFFNINPARIFMGDTGSLFLGALAVSLAFSVKNPLLIIPIGIVYVIEGLSVILQVVYYKLTKKRLFKMAPLHHHMERCGLNENRICIIAVITTLIFSAAAIFLSRS